MDPHEQCQPLSVSSVTPHNTPSVLKWVHVRDAPVPRDTRECKLGHSEMPPHDTPPPRQLGGKNASTCVVWGSQSFLCSRGDIIPVLGKQLPRCDNDCDLGS